MHIIAGKYKNRIIPTTQDGSYRPSTGKLREAIFSILCSGKYVDLVDAHVLDLFSGTGSLAFEAISRGAHKATLVDINKQHLELAMSFVRSIGEEGRITCMNVSATNLPQSLCRYNVALIDPPYNNGLVEPTLRSLLDGHWLDDDAILIIETSKSEMFLLHTQFTMIDVRIYGKTKITIVRFKN